MDLEQIISFIFNPTFSGWLLVLKIIFVILSLLLFGFIIFALIKTTWLKRMIIWDLQEFLTYRPFGVSKIAGKWQKIKKRLEAGIESEAKLAIIEADSMLDGILDRMGFGGRTLGERLDRLTDVSLPNIEEAKKSHKIRNNIVHDPTYKLDLEEAKKVISAYEKALTDLQAL